MDLTNNSNIKCFSFNDPSLITCYANDYKFENWISNVVYKYGNKNDLIILISSSGESRNMIKAAKAAKKKKFSKIVTFTGFKKKTHLIELEILISGSTPKNIILLKMFTNFIYYY